MKDIVAQFLNEYVDNISEKTIELFYTIAKISAYKKGETVLRYGKKPVKFFIIKQGVVGSFTKDKAEDKEYIRTLYTGDLNTVFTDLSSIENNANTLGNITNYVCLTDCEILEGDFEDFRALTLSHHELSLLYNRILEKAFVRSERRIDELSLFDATQRYRNLKSQISNIDNLVPQYQIAYYLNVTPVQLSRIRKKMYYE